MERYVVPAIDLLADAEAYDPEGILVWAQQLQSYGSWDSDHWDLIVFGDVSWTDIAANRCPT